MADSISRQHMASILHVSEQHGQRDKQESSTFAMMSDNVCNREYVDRKLT